MKPREAAARLGLSQAMVYALCEQGKLRHTRKGALLFIVEEDLQAFIASRSTVSPKSR